MVVSDEIVVLVKPPPFGTKFGKTTSGDSAALTEAILVLNAF
jgi:hypothetical protein